MKICFKCKVKKPLSEFYKHKMMADGHLNKCKKCAKNDVLEHRNKNLESIREYDRMRCKEPKKRASLRISTDRWAQKFPEKHKAKSMVKNAVRDGRLKRLPCEVCGSDERIHGHHDDYSKPLDVRWLCAAHHHQHHAKMRRNLKLC